MGAGDLRKAGNADVTLSPFAVTPSPFAVTLSPFALALNPFAVTLSEAKGLRSCFSLASYSELQRCFAALSMTVSNLVHPGNAVRWHLTGRDDHGRDFVMGVYPMLLDETCFFLATLYRIGLHCPDFSVREEVLGAIKLTDAGNELIADVIAKAGHARGQSLGIPGRAHFQPKDYKGNKTLDIAAQKGYITYINMIAQQLAAYIIEEDM